MSGYPVLNAHALDPFRAPLAALLGLRNEEAKAFGEVFEDLVATISAEPGATVATARAELRD